MVTHKVSVRPHGAALRSSSAQMIWRLPIRAGLPSPFPHPARIAATLRARPAGVTPAFAADARASALRRPTCSLAAPVLAWSFFKKLGLKKPAFLPDFGLKKRRALLQRFYGPIDRRVYEELLAPDFLMVEEGGGGHPTRTFTREGTNAQLQRAQTK